MKNLSSVLFAFLILSLVSCSESQEEEPRSPLIGTWEKRDYIDSLDVWFVESFQFKNDSIIDITAIARKTELGETLGYRYITTSWYNLEGNFFQYYYSDAMIYSGVSEGFRTFYGPKEELRPGIFDFFRIPKGELTFSSDFSQFTFQEECWKINSESEDCFEFPSQTFVRVD
ncbi:hypothetical protein JYB64_00840 [Algoriphagus aestuarii]|nr:hypothetical protein [Algoriphagus aestuarii]